MLALLSSLQINKEKSLHEVPALLGVGGIGEVYRATDTRLKRQVAIRILPSSLAADPDRLASAKRKSWPR